MGTAGLVFGLLSITVPLLGPIFGLAGFILSIIGCIKKQQNAVGGLVCSIIGLIFSVLLIASVVVLFNVTDNILDMFYEWLESVTSY